MLELWGMRSTLSLPSHPSLLSAGVEVPIYGLNRIKLCHYTKLNCLKLIVLTFKCVFKLRAELFEIELFLTF